MLGGTLTLIGTSTNLLANDLSRQLLDHPIGMFEFTPLGILVLLVGIGYLLTVGRWLTPSRIAPESEFTSEYDLDRFISRVQVREESSVIGRPLADVQGEFDEGETDVDILRLERDDETFLAGWSDHVVEPGDTLVVRSTKQALNLVAEE